MTEKELRAQHGDIIAQIEQETRDKTIAEEHARLQAIEEIADTIGDPQLIAEAKYGAERMTAAQLALVVMKKRAGHSAQHLDNVRADYGDSGAAGVGAAADLQPGQYNTAPHGEQHEE